MKIGVRVTVYRGTNDLKMCQLRDNYSKKDNYSNKDN